MKTTKMLMLLCVGAILLTTNSYAQRMTKEIILGCETSLLPSTVWVAENRGYFEGEGLDLTIGIIH